MKNFYFVVFALACAWPLLAQPDAEQLEERLAVAEGQERLEPLVELTTLYHAENAPRAILLGTEALDLLTAYPDVERQLEILNRLASAHIVEGDYRLALRLESRAEQLARESNNRPQLALAFRNRGRAYRSLSEYRQALEEYGTAIELYETLDDRPGYGEALNDTGIVYWMLSDFPRALEYFFRAHGVHEETGDRQRIAGILNNIGIVYRKLQQDDKALDYYNQALEIRKQVGPSGSLANVLNNIGNIHRDRREPAEALEHYFKALEIGLADRHGHTNTLSNIATAYEDSGDLDRALVYYEKTIELKREIGEREGLAYGHLGIARIRRRKGELDRAISNLKRSIEIAESIDSSDNAQPAFLELSEIYADMGRYREALAAFQQYETLKSQIFNQQNSQAIAEMEARFESDQKEREIEILRQQQAIDALELKRQELTRRMLLGGLALLLLIILLLHNRYRLKVRSARQRRRLEKERVRQEERERYVAELETKNAEVETRKAEMERFAYVVSHDLKSPLVTIRGFLGLAKREALAGNTERMEADLERVDAAASRMARLLDELLQLARIGRVVNDPQAVSMAELAREAIENLSSHVADRGVDVSIAPDLPTAYGDRPRLLEIWQNLVENAVKFMGDQPGPRLEIGWRNGAEPIYYVRDNGIGVEPRHHQRIFSLFDRLDQSIDGTGVGLALVKRIAEVHGGRSWIESQGEGKGSTFCFTLPAAEPGDAVKMEVSA